MGKLRHKAIKFIAFGKHPQIGLCSSSGDPLLVQPSTGRCLPDLICLLPDPLLNCANHWRPSPWPLALLMTTWCLTPTSH